MAIQWYEEVPAVCQNKECQDYGCFELIDVEDVLTDDVGGYILCPTCGKRITIND